MIKVKREEFKSDPIFQKVYEVVKRNHVSANHTINTLIENRDIKDFCEISCHFAVIPPNLPISYEAWSWLENSRVLIKIESITFYDNDTEYMVERAKGMKDLSGFVERN